MRQKYPQKNWKTFNLFHTPVSFSTQPFIAQKDVLKRYLEQIQAKIQQILLKLSAVETEKFAAMSRCILGIQKSISQISKTVNNIDIENWKETEEALQEQLTLQNKHAKKCAKTLNDLEEKLQQSIEAKQETIAQQKIEDLKQKRLEYLQTCSQEHFSLIDIKYTHVKTLQELKKQLEVRATRLSQAFENPFFKDISKMHLKAIRDALGALNQALEDTDVLYQKRYKKLQTLAVNLTNPLRNEEAIPETTQLSQLKASGEKSQLLLSKQNKKLEELTTALERQLNAAETSINEALKKELAALQGGFNATSSILAKAFSERKALIKALTDNNTQVSEIISENELKETFHQPLLEMRTRLLSEQSTLSIKQNQLDSYRDTFNATAEKLKNSLDHDADKAECAQWIMNLRQQKEAIERFYQDETSSNNIVEAEKQFELITDDINGKFQSLIKGETEKSKALMDKCHQTTTLLAEKIKEKEEVEADHARCKTPEVITEEINNDTQSKNDAMVSIMVITVDIQCKLRSSAQPNVIQTLNDICSSIQTCMEPKKLAITNWLLSWLESFLDWLPWGETLLSELQEFAQTQRTYNENIMAIQKINSALQKINNTLQMQNTNTGTADSAALARIFDAFSQVELESLSNYFIYLTPDKQKVIKELQDSFDEFETQKQTYHTRENSIQLNNNLRHKETELKEKSNQLTSEINTIEGQKNLLEARLAQVQENLANLRSQHSRLQTAYPSKIEEQETTTIQLSF